AGENAGRSAARVGAIAEEPDRGRAQYHIVEDIGLNVNRGVLVNVDGRLEAQTDVAAFNAVATVGFVVDRGLAGEEARKGRAALGRVVVEAEMPVLHPVAAKAEIAVELEDMKLLPLALGRWQDRRGR